MNSIGDDLARAYEDGYNNGYRDGMEKAHEQIDAAPTIDAVEVVRCGECANRNTCDCPLAYAVESGIGNDLPGDDDFCSYGARMDADALERGKEEQDGQTV